MRNGRPVTYDFHSMKVGEIRTFLCKSVSTEKSIRQAVERSQARASAEVVLRFISEPWNQRVGVERMEDSPLDITQDDKSANTLSSFTDMTQTLQDDRQQKTPAMGTGVTGTSEDVSATVF